MSKKKVGIIIGVIAAAVVAAGVGFYFLKGRSSGGNSADKVYVEKSICNYEPVSRNQ